MMKHYKVVAAVFTDEAGRIYCARRKDEGELALKWEFPGGKIESGESNQEALVREIKEELSADIEVLDYITTVEHQYNTFKLTMHAYYTKIIKGDLVLSEHTGFKWLNKEELMTLDWAPADIPIVKILMK
jgi:8-oxo-dGTP diphosphatase